MSHPICNTPGFSSPKSLLTDAPAQPDSSAEKSKAPKIALSFLIIKTPLHCFGRSQQKTKLTYSNKTGLMCQCIIFWRANHT